MICFKRIHQYFGYFVFFTVQAAVCSGLLMQARSSDQEETITGAYLLVVLNCVGLAVALIVGECRHRSILAGEVEWRVKKKRSMTKFDFNNAIRLGQKYVILDEMVIDIGSFMYFHPGGKFVLQ